MTQTRTRTVYSAGDSVVLPDGSVGSVIQECEDGTVEVNCPFEAEHPDKPGVTRAWCEPRVFRADELRSPDGDA